MHQKLHWYQLSQKSFVSLIPGCFVFVQTMTESMFNRSIDWHGACQLQVGRGEVIKVTVSGSTRRPVERVQEVDAVGQGRHWRVPGTSSIKLLAPVTVEYSQSLKAAGFWPSL